jgi:hypothetical protein
VGRPVMASTLLLLWCSGCRWEGATSASTPKDRVGGKRKICYKLKTYSGMQRLAASFDSDG